MDAGGRGLDAHRQVLGDEHDAPPLELQVLGDGQDARVVVAQAEAIGQRGDALVVELDVHVAAVDADRQRRGEVAVALAEVVEDAQGLAGEVAEVGVVALGLELGDDDDRQHDVVLGEAHQRMGVRQQHGRVEHVGEGLGAQALEDSLLRAEGGDDGRGAVGQSLLRCQRRGPHLRPADVVTMRAAVEVERCGVVHGGLR